MDADAKRLKAGSEANSLKRGMAVLEMLAVSPEGATLRDITKRLHLPGASALRITRTLVDLGYLSRDERSKRYSLTNQFLLFGQPRAATRSFSECAVPAMRTIREATGETTQLCCLIDTEMVILEQFVSVHPFKYTADLGARCPCYSCAPGKAIVAYLPEIERERIVEQISFKRFTPTTLSSKRAFRQEIEVIRGKGFALDRAEGMPGIHCVAAPILDRHGAAVGAITIAGPSNRIPEDEFDVIGEIVRTGAKKASVEFNRR